MACEAIQQKLDGLKELRRETEGDLKEPGLSPTEKSRLQQQLKQLGAQISAVQIQLDQCLKDAASHPFLPVVTTAVPQRILDIQYQNPPFTPGPGDWAKALANGPNAKPTDKKTFPQDVGMEWVQPLAPADEYDQFSLVGATGWGVNPRTNTIDFPFDHPFGFDWEFSMALDPARAGTNGPFDFLLAPGNKATPAHQDMVEDETIATQFGLPRPKGLLGIEWDAGLIPNTFINQVKTGHRVATFGRWIVDTGHDVYRTEIHPPLLMAAASNSADATHVMFTSRPYLGGQTYTVDVDKAYDDTAQSDGTFYSHLVEEVVKVVEHRSLLVEAHPKVKSHPFLGAHLLHVVVRTPTPASPISALKHLAISFQFTIRSGCAVQVTSSAPDTVDVFISLSHGGYTPPALPHRNGKRYSRDELDHLKSGAGGDYLNAEILASAAGLLTGGPISSAEIAIVLSRGVETDAYDAVNATVNLLDASHAVQNVGPNNIPAGKGIVQNDNQPFPIFGWLEAKWVGQIATQ